MTKIERINEEIERLKSKITDTCNVCGKTTIGGDIGDCIKSHFHGRVKITLTEEENGGIYTAVLNMG